MVNFSFLPNKKHNEYSDELKELHPELFINKDPITTMVRTITFQVTDDCCMACTYCYQRHKEHNFMTKETAKQFVDWLLDENNTYINVENTPGIIIEFIGGEPFMAIELIDYICDYFTEQTIQKHHQWAIYHRFSICSNGLLYFEPQVQEFLLKHGLDLSFSISIDGNKELHDMCRKDLEGNGTYDRAMKAVQHFNACFPMASMGSKMTLSPENISFTAAAVENLIENNYTDIHLNCVYEEGWNYNHATVLYNELKELTAYIIGGQFYKTVTISMFNYDFFKPKSENDDQNWCGGVNNIMLAMDYKGDFYPCIRYMESSLNNNQPPVKIGNVSHGMYVTEEEQKWYKELYDVGRRVQSTNECFNCPIAEGCSWCSAYNYEVYGTVKKRATFICPMHKATALANAYYWNLIFITENVPYRFKLYLPDEEALKIISKDELKMLHSLETFPHYKFSKDDVL